MVCVIIDHSRRVGIEITGHGIGIRGLEIDSKNQIKQDKMFWGTDQNIEILGSGINVSGL